MRNGSEICEEGLVCEEAEEVEAAEEGEIRTCNGPFTLQGS